jgi:hypothetical protein
MKSLVEALQKEHVKLGIRKGVPPGKKRNPRANALNPAAKGASNKLMKNIGAY